MSEGEAVLPGDLEDVVEIGPTVAHSARMYDYLLGGSTNFEVDRAAVDRATAAVGGIDNARAAARANRAFLARAVRYLAGEAGVRQFLDIGTGIPGSDGWHADPQQIAADARVVYVDNDPIVLAHAHTLLTSTPEGAAAYVDGDLRDPETILGGVKETLDLSRPVAVVLGMVLHLVPDRDDPHGVVARLVDALPSGSYLAVSHVTSEVLPREVGELAGQLGRAAEGAFVTRDLGEVRRFFDGLQIIEPGVVPVEHWRPDAAEARPRWLSSAYGGIGRKG
ncbi:MAG: SAM-dependent methyltransferase [Acidimicrobiales bacterium]